MSARILHADADRFFAAVEPRMHAYSEASKALYAVFEDTTPLVEGVSIALDETRDRFGTKAVTRAVLLGRDDLTMPLLPD